MMCFTSTLIFNKFSNNSICGSNNIPTTMTAGQTYRVFVDLANTENTNWGSTIINAFKLGEVDDFHTTGGMLEEQVKYALNHYKNAQAKTLN